MGRGRGLYSTAADYLAFERTLLNEGRADSHQAVPLLKPSH